MLEIDAQTSSQARNIWERKELRKKIEDTKSEIAIPVQEINYAIQENIVKQTDLDTISKEQGTIKNGIYKKLNDIIKKQNELEEKINKILKLLE